MPAEIIRRKEGEMSQKNQIRAKREQVSLNDYEHLVIRFFNGANEEEHLVVFSEDTTRRIIDFIRRQNPAHEFMQFLKEVVRKKIDDLPF